MSSSQELKVTERDTTITPRQLRAAGYIPATLYGPGIEPTSLQVRAHEFNQFFLQGISEYQLIGYYAGLATAQQVQRDPVSMKPLSVQFFVPEQNSARQGNQKSTPAKPEPALAGV